MQLPKRLALAVPVAAALAALSFPGLASASTRAPAHRVVAGDTLWAIGVRAGIGWQTLAAYNHLPNPDLIIPGQVIQMPPPGWSPPASSAPAQPAVSAVPRSYAPARSYSAPTRSYAPYAVPRASSGFEACVIARESGGNSQIWGGAGGAYYGLYQFSRSTWIANGGAPGDFGHASAAEQHAVFSRTSPSAWSPYDGC
jgi:LysM repeat protein